MDKVKDFLAVLILAVSFIVGIGILVFFTYQFYTDDTFAFWILTGLVIGVIIIGWAVNQLTKTKK